MCDVWRGNMRRVEGPYWSENHNEKFAEFKIVGQKNQLNRNANTCPNWTNANRDTRSSQYIYIYIYIYSWYPPDTLLTRSWHAPDTLLTRSWHAPDMHHPDTLLTLSWHAPDTLLTRSWHAPDTLLIRSCFLCVHVLKWSYLRALCYLIPFIVEIRLAMFLCLTWCWNILGNNLEQINHQQTIPPFSPPSQVTCLRHPYGWTHPASPWFERTPNRCARMHSKVKIAGQILSMQIPNGCARMHSKVKIAG